MLGVLVVDDEKLASADIVYKVSRSGFCFKWIMEASSAEEALKKIKEYKPDILLTDIMMGEMSGIDLVKAAANYAPGIASVLISGHSDFGIARKAIALGVFEYLLKPIRQEELTETLSKVITKEMHRRNQLQNLVNYRELKNFNINENYKEQLLAFFHGMITNLGFPMTEIFPDTMKYFQIGLFRISIKLHSDKLLQAIQDIVQEAAGQRFLTFYDINMGQQITVIAASPEDDYKKSEEMLLRSFKEIERKVRKQLDVVMVMGVSGIEETVTGALLTQARQALDLRFSFKNTDSRMFYWSEWEKSTAMNLPEEDFKLYQKFLVAGDLKEALAVVKRIFSVNISEAAMHIRILYVELICILARTSIKKAGGRIVSMLGPECLSGRIIDEFACREELIESVCKTITTVLDQWMTIATDTRSVLIIVKKYIEDNFTNSEISTNFLAQKFCISLGYLSTSFNKEFGTPITKYIINLRMDYAKKLLKETRLCICDIADNCGFCNTSYFMRTFKKHIGCTPNDFRENDSFKIINE